MTQQNPKTNKKNEDKFSWQPEDIVWDDPDTQKEWEATHTPDKDQPGKQENAPKKDVQKKEK